MASPQAHEQFKLPITGGLCVEVRLGDFPRTTIRADRPRSETRLAFGLRVFGAASDGPALECVAEYWSGFHFDAVAETRISQWLSRREQGGAETLSVDDFLEELESFLAEDLAEMAPGAVKESSDLPAARNLPESLPIKSKIMSETLVVQEFRRRMEPVEVSLSEDGFVVLSTGQAENSSKIRVHPSQVELLCQWIEEARQTLEKP